MKESQERETRRLTVGADETPRCPHCGEQMRKWEPPPQNTWSEDFHYVCFNDECPYYTQGWAFMWKTRESRSSYRCQYNPRNGVCSPVPVWTPYDLKDGIID